MIGLTHSLRASHRGLMGCNEAMVGYKATWVVGMSDVTTLTGYEGAGAGLMNGMRGSVQAALSDGCGARRSSGRER